jgi:tetratricopeptide (TPR) repeat protein
MMLPWLWTIVVVVMTVPASSMQNAPGEWCRPAITTDQSPVPITCQGVDPQLLQSLNAFLDTQELDLHDKVRQASLWMRTYHALVQRLAAGAGDHALLREAYTLAHAGKLVEAGTLLDHMLTSPGDVSPERLADAAFSRAEMLALQFQLREALPYYAAAARMHATHPQYAYRYAVVLQQQRQYAEAESLYRAALHALRPLVSADPTTSLPVVAMVLESLASLYHTMQRLPEAEAVYQEAVTMYRQLAQTEPRLSLPALAAMLHNVGILYTNTRRFPEAEAAYREALAIYRQLAQIHSAAYHPAIATTLTNLAVLYNYVHRFPEAESAYHEALSLRRQLAQTHPVAYLPKVATTLHNLGALYIDARRFAEAETAYHEALTLRRQVAQGL